MPGFALPVISMQWWISTSSWRIHRILHNCCLRMIPAIICTHRSVDIEPWHRPCRSLSSRTALRRRTESEMVLMANSRRCVVALVATWLVFGTCCLHAEDGAAGWLRYVPLRGPARALCQTLPAAIVSSSTEGPGEPITSAERELKEGMAGICGIKLHNVTEADKEPAFVIGTVPYVKTAVPAFAPAAVPGPEGFILARRNKSVLIAGHDGRGVLYGTF